MHVILPCALAMTIWSGGGSFAKKVGLESGFWSQAGHFSGRFALGPPIPLRLGFLPIR